MPALRHYALILCLGLTIAAAADSGAPVPVEGPVRVQHLTVELLPLQGSIQPGGNEQVSRRASSGRSQPASPPEPCSFPRPAACRLAR